MRALKIQVRKAAGGGAGGVPGGVSSGASDAASEEDAFAGVDTPKSTPSPSVKKLCMVCMDAERGEHGGGGGACRRYRIVAAW